jgi:hypothetical protein
MSETVSGSRGAMIKPGCPRAFDTILYGGLAAGVGDGLFAVVFYGVIKGVKLLRIFQGVASGLLGRAAFDGGVATFSLGLLLHFVVASCIAAVFYLLSSIWPALLRRAIVSGLIYGMLAYLVMNYVVIPLSAARHGTFHLSNFIIEMIGHAFLVGLPIALVAAGSASRRRTSS